MNNVVTLDHDQPITLDLEAVDYKTVAEHYAEIHHSARHCRASIGTASLVKGSLLSSRALRVLCESTIDVHRDPSPIACQRLLD